MKIEFYHANAKSDKLGTIPKKEFNNINSLLVDMSYALVESRENNIVFLISIHSKQDEDLNFGDSDIFVTNKRELIHEFVRKIILNRLASWSDPEYFIHLHEYPSYEDAYKVALDMKEVNPLCYNK